MNPARRAVTRAFLRSFSSLNGPAKNHVPRRALPGIVPGPNRQSKRHQPADDFVGVQRHPVDTDLHKPRFHLAFLQPLARQPLDATPARIPGVRQPALHGP